MPDATQQPPSMARGSDSDGHCGPVVTSYGTTSVSRPSSAGVSVVDLAVRVVDAVPLSRIPSSRLSVAAVNYPRRIGDPHLSSFLAFRQQATLRRRTFGVLFGATCEGKGSPTFPGRDALGRTGAVPARY
ncbi:hypothetical protein MTO96_015556 [Rhipicephalus appendiculatus]